MRLLFYPVHTTENKRDIIKFSEEQRVEIELRVLPIQFPFPQSDAFCEELRIPAFDIFYFYIFINLLSLSGYKAKRRKILNK